MKRMTALVLALARLGRGGEKILLANAAGRSPEHFRRKLALAIGAKPDLDDDELDAAHDEHMANVHAAMANEDEDGDMPPGPDSEIDNTAPEIEGAANEREIALAGKAAGLLIANALIEGRILPNARDEWIERFGDDFDAAEAALANEKRKLKTAPVTAGLGGRQSTLLGNAKDRRAKIHALVNAKKAEGLSYDEAFLAVQTDPAHADLFTTPTTESK